MRASELSASLADKAEQVVSHLLPKGNKINDHWCVGSLHGEQGKSLKVCLQEDKRGLWSDFATGESGDLLTLWAMVKQISLIAAMQQVRGWLNLSQINFHPLPTKAFKKPSGDGLSDVTMHTEMVNYLTQTRCLSLTTLKQFQIKAYQQYIVFPYYRDDTLRLLKYLHLSRDKGRKMIHASKQSEPCLFGWQALSPDTREITLTEGEIDAMSLHQYGIAALSLPFGGGTGNKHQWLEYEFEHLSGFDIIYLCFDNDDTGKATIETLIDRLGRHRVRIVALPHKDINECLQANISATEIKQYWLNAHSLDPIELKPAKHFLDLVYQELYPDTAQQKKHLAFPWQKTHGKLALRPAELSIWTGINGHGKSQFLGHVMLHMLASAAKVCIASLELTPERLLTRLARQAGAIEKPSKAYLTAIHEWYGDKLWLFNLVGKAKSEKLLDVFLYARQRYGIDVFVIDSLLKLDINEDDYTKQKTFVEQLCDFKNTHGVHIHLVVHPRKGINEKQVPNKLDAKGTGAISDLADNCFSIWRNKFNEQAPSQQTTSEDNQPDCLLICDKQRNGAWEGSFGFWFDTQSLQYLTYPNAIAQPFVHYSCLTQSSQGNNLHES